MKELLTAIVTWLSINFGLPATDDHPAIEFRSASQIADSRYGTMQRHMQPEIIAAYDDATRTILLPDDWAANTPADLSILVHEMVHHLQNVAKLQYECPASREKDAYRAQEAWLRLFGRSLLSEFEIDRMTLKLTTECMPY